jgi:hypothetical protein
MATTTNYGWTTPDDTDLVKDGAAAIRTLGSSIDTSFVADELVIYCLAAQAIFLNLWPIGAADTVLTSDGTTASWAAPAAGSLTKISTTSFSNVATQDIDSVFNSTYNTYLVVINQIYAATQANPPQLQMRYSTTTDVSSYFGLLDNMSYLGTSTLVGTNNGSECRLANQSGASGFPASAVFYINFPLGGGATSRTHIYGSSFDSLGGVGSDFVYEATDRNWTGFRLKASASNVSGIVTVFGVEK